jgi:hypothetical protein
MKKALLLKPMLLLFALIVGSSSAWAEDILDEPFNISGTAEVSSTYNGWSVTRCWGGNGSIRLGASSGDKGQLITPALTALSGDATLTFEVKRYSTDTGSIGISIESGEGSVSGDVSVASSSISADTWTKKTVTITGGNSSTIIKFLMTNKRMYLRNVKIVSGSSSVAVTGVTLNPTSLTMEIGDTETLIATVAPSNATNKSVTWSSSNGNVATVSNGVVTAVGVGNATITVTTVDGNKTATCDVTVTASGGGGENTPSVTFDFSESAWGWPSTTTAAGASYTNHGYTFTFGTVSADGHKVLKNQQGDQIGVMFGKQGATLSFPAFPFNVNKIIIYGNSTASSNTSFNLFVGEAPVSSTNKTSCKDNHVFDIPLALQAAGTIYVYKVLNAYNAQITKIEVFGYENVAVTTAGLATFASDNNLDFTNVEGLVANSAKINGNTVTFESVETVPAGQGVLLKATEELTETATFAVPVVSTVTPWAAADNDFIRGKDEAVQSTENNTYNYILSTNASGVVGFYLAAGKTIPKNRAYLSTTSTGAPALDMNWGDETTGIVNVNRETITNNQYYTLDGRRVAEPTKGLYIINGKKVVIK